MPEISFAYSVDEIESTARKILKSCPNERIFAISGEMGAGKTTLIKALCASLGSEDEFSSPSFGIVNEYVAGEQIYHIDLYRLSRIEEALDAGIEEYLNGRYYCFIEWPELIEPLLGGETARVKIEMAAGELRTLHIGCS